MKREFALSLVLHVEPEVLFEAWLNSREHANFTGSPARISPKVGGKLAAWDDYITGETLEVERYKRILQSWRTTDFSDQDPDSKIEITFEKVDTGTKLILKHFDIPERRADEYKQGWKDFYFKPMKNYYSK